MAAIGPGVFFIHRPRTGGTYFQAQLERAGVARVLPGDSHRLPTEAELRGRREVVFVRHPLEWLISYHSFRKRGGRSCVPELDGLIDDSSCFLGFCDKLLRDRTALPRAWARFEPTGADAVVCRHERLRAGLNAVLSMCGAAPLPCVGPEHAGRDVLRDVTLDVAEKLYAGHRDFYEAVGYAEATRVT